ncbi:hypothetical protein LTR60_000805 [Cryomyces antarcticus]|nr:hypothetical protein LTR60_000805 [Cryomyces antarcticus]
MQRDGTPGEQDLSARVEDMPFSNQYNGFNHQAFAASGADEASAAMTNDPQFDILEWHPAYRSCQRYFLDHAQHDPGTQALAALINICLPFQWSAHPVIGSSSHSPQITGPLPNCNYNPWPRHNMPSPLTRGGGGGPQNWVSLVPYISRLVVTGFDKDGILHGFFGDDWRKGIGPIQDCERRNYLFAAKHGGWRSCKKQYDMDSHETVPFLKPLDRARIEEIEGAERTWSQWLAMEDWMVGPRAPVENTMDERAQNRGGGDREGG